MSELVRADCGSCERIIYQRGVKYVVEAARSPKATTPADDFIRSLEIGKAEGRKQLADLAVRFEKLALNGTLLIPRELNDLVDGIREIKAGKLRILFYDASCSSTPSVRLTNGFIKGTERTPRRHIYKAKWVREGDQKR